MKLKVTPQRYFVSIMFLAFLSVSGYFSFSVLDYFSPQEPPDGDRQKVYVNGTVSDEDLRSAFPFVNAYPNPFRGDYFVIEITTDHPDFENDNYSAEVYDVLGRQVAGANLQFGVNTIHSSNYQPGVYFVNVIRNQDIIRTLRVVKQAY